MKNLLKATAILLLFFAIDCRAQVTVFTDVTGRPLSSKTYDGIEGSPYLYDDWMNATVKTTNGTVYKNLSLKYNEREGKPYFKGKDEETMEFIEPVAEFTINDKGLDQHFIASAGIFYEILANGNTKLLRQPVKEVQQTTAYVGAAVTKTFVSAYKYFVMQNGLLGPLKRDKKAILATLANKQPEMDAYLKKESPNLKDDAELAKLFIYYNSL